jgi:hypothetical protein
MTTPVTPHTQQRRPRRRIAQIVIAMVVIFLLVPVVYLFGQLWTSTGSVIGTATTERAAVAYARPLNKLLAALVDAQYTAVRGATVDASSARAAIDEVNAVDRRLADPLQIRPRWTHLTREIDGTLGQNLSGSDALRVYAPSIALTQALLDRIANASKVAHDPGLGSYQLIDVALHGLPDVVAAAGQVAAVVFATDDTTPPTRSNRPAVDARLVVALDRLARAANDVSLGLRAGTDPSANYAVDLRLLSPLDEFTAAADELAQTAAGLQAPGGGDRDRIDAASSRVKAATLALESAVLNAFDTQLTASVNQYNAQRRVLVLAGAVIAVAAAALLWLRIPAPAAPPVRVPAAAVDKIEGRHGYPVEVDEVRPDGSQRIPNLVDARELLAPDLVPAGRAGRPRKRLDHNDHQ